MHGDEQRRQSADAPTSQETSKNMTSEQYNGWTNRETWLANIWLDAGEVENGAFIRLATELSASELADSLEDYYASVLPELPSGLYADLLAGAVARINWREIARKLSEDVLSELGGKI